MTVMTNITFIVSSYIEDVVHDVYDSRAIHLHHIIYQESYISEIFKIYPDKGIF